MREALSKSELKNSDLMAYNDSWAETDQGVLEGLNVGSSFWWVTNQFHVK